MAATAYQTKYRQEYIAGFEKNMSLARRTVITEADVNGNQAVFLVADSGAETAVTRGVNGDIPTRPDNLNQYTATLQEWHDIPERTRFNIYASQGDGRRIMQETSRAVMNRKIDKDIHSALTNGTQTKTMSQAGGASAFLVDILDMKTTLGENNALDEEPFCLITPAFHANLMQIEQFTSADYINLKPFENVSKSRAFNWYGVNWIVDTDLDGVGTASAECYMYARKAIGHACDTDNLQVEMDYDKKNDKSWVRVSTFMGSKVLQDSGIIVITHDDTDLTLGS